MSKHTSCIKEILVSGFALFAMFFGAGNLIFPPELGLMSGTEWFPSFLGFFIMDAGLAILGVFAVLEIGGNLNEFGGKLGSKFAQAISIIVVLCLGPCVAVPRTGALTFSMAIKPFLGSLGNGSISLFIFSLLFYGLVLFLCIKPGKVVDVIGTYMTPILLLFLILMIILGICFTSINPASALVTSPIKEGVTNGYQTMDGMASMLFAGIVIESIYGSKKHTDKESKKILFFSSLLACLLLFIVYGGLTYLGAVWGRSVADLYLTHTIDQAGLLTSIVNEIMGSSGVIVISIITLFACLTTAIGLTSASAAYFDTLFQHKISYKKIVFIICLLATLLCNIGLDQILEIAQPILSLMYPLIITLILLNVFKRCIYGRAPFILGAISSFGISIMNVLSDTFHIKIFQFIHSLPFDTIGMNFLLPTILFVGLGLFIDIYQRKKIVLIKSYSIE